MVAGQVDFGCARHSAFIYDRGGTQRLGQIDRLTLADWSRVRDDMSKAKVATAAPSSACARLLSEVEPNRHELVIYRENERVWEGPISLLTMRAGQVEIEARDVMYYAHRTVNHVAYDSSYPNIETVVERAERILAGELARKEALDPPINVLDHVRSWHRDDDARTSRVTVDHSTTVFEDIDSMAARSGLDYTVVGRSILLFDTRTVFHTTPVVTEEDFLDGVILSVYGMEGATRAFVHDGLGHHGTWGDALDPYYGEWEIIDQVYEEGVSDGTAPSVSEMNSQARRNLSGRNPVPFVVRVPDNTQLSPHSRLTMDHLVPGVRIPLRATWLLRKVAQMQKLDSVRVIENSDGESVRVVMGPASADDAAIGEE